MITRGIVAPNGQGEPHFTPAEEETRLAVEPQLDSLVLDSDQLRGLSGSFYDCSETFEENTRIDYHFSPDWDRNGAELRSVEVVERVQQYR